MSRSSPVLLVIDGGLPQCEAGMTVPPGFMPIERKPGFLQSFGTLYSRARSGGYVIGVMGHDGLCNSRGSLHGGALATIADVALGYACEHRLTEGSRVTTVSLTVDYIAAAAGDSWIEARCRIVRAGAFLMFARTRICSGNAEIASASGIFAVRHAGRTDTS